MPKKGRRKGRHSILIRGKGKSNSMKALFPLLLLLLFSAGVFSEGIRPESVKNADLNIRVVASGSISGEVSDGDSMEVRMLTFAETPAQKIGSISERLFFGESVFAPSSYRENPSGGNKVAVFLVDDLSGQDKTFRVVVEANVRASSSLELPSGNLENDEGLSEYLGASAYMESDDPEIADFAESNFSGDVSLEIVRAAAEWVYRNIEYDYDYYPLRNSAKETFDLRKGVCDEFANLTGAFLRARGIPVRYVTGISFDGERFGNHGWIEAFTGNGWVGVDSTYGEAGYLDASHVSLSKDADANEAVVVSLSTSSLKALSAELTLHEPQVTVNSMDVFENVLLAEIVKPEKVAPGEAFGVGVMLENTLGGDVIIPVKLALYDSFPLDPDGSERLVWLREGEKRLVEWRTIAPGELLDGYAEYDMALFLPDRVERGKIAVHKPEREIVLDGGEGVLFEGVANTDLLIGLGAVSALLVCVLVLKSFLGRKS